MRESLEQLPGTEPGAEKGAEKVPLLRELSRAARTARSRPHERSPLYWMAYEPGAPHLWTVGKLRTVLEIALAVPEKWAATRQRNGLEPLPFLPPPEAPEPVADYEQQLEERKAKLAPEEKEVGGLGPRPQRWAVRRRCGRSSAEASRATSASALVPKAFWRKALGRGLGRPVRASGRLEPCVSGRSDARGGGEGGHGDHAHHAGGRSILGRSPQALDRWLESLKWRPYLGRLSAESIEMASNAGASRIRRSTAIVYYCHALLCRYIFIKYIK